MDSLYIVVELRNNICKMTVYMVIYLHLCVCLIFFFTYNKQVGEKVHYENTRWITPFFIIIFYIAEKGIFFFY